MDYHGFLKYRETLSHVRWQLDDLNPYPLRQGIPINLKATNFTLKTSNNGYIKKSQGVRQLLADLLQDFIQANRPIYMPEDVYPVYFQLVKKQANVHSYKSCQIQCFKLAKEENAVYLITNPLIPEGRYLSNQQLATLDQWLLESPQRWLIVDTAYDFWQKAIKNKFKASQIIFLGSLSKLCLQPKTQGWAISKAPFPGALPSTEKTIPLSISKAYWLQQQFDQAWQSLARQEVLHDFYWRPPEAGYLTIVRCHYKKLYQQLNISAVPNSVFGIRDNNISVISCLSFIKNNQF